MSELVFYTNPQSRGRIAHWMMEELGEPYSTVWLDYGTTMKAPEYLAVNPMGKVPTVKHGALVVTEAAAICAYLADAFPEKQLAPPPGDPDRAAYYRWLFFAAGPLEQAVTAKSMGWQVPEGRSAMVGFGSYTDTLHALETALTPGPFICGERFTAADVYVGSSLGWGLMFGTIEKRPVFEAYVTRLLSRPAAVVANRLNEARMQSPVT
ncbi:glutathione S-transferase family protein [Hydrogenophaga sp. A37]|uniref:glutathione S-transferase family protein n=1 Tax=Hydrogenophaga sp. A37 TaxID=1945864 RepID=UPI00098656BC|nr:glutathione S-transferase family protein [Hydrogenophaga sp. A37]OOG79617.1 glutathione S-transferase [Hydrogenophaga sp. A37]